MALYSLLWQWRCKIENAKVTTKTMIASHLNIPLLFLLLYVHVCTGASEAKRKAALTADMSPLFFATFSPNICLPNWGSYLAGLISGWHLMPPPRRRAPSDGKSMAFVRFMSFNVVDLSKSSDLSCKKSIVNNSKSLLCARHAAAVCSSCYQMLLFALFAEPHFRSAEVL